MAQESVQYTLFACGPADRASTGTVASSSLTRLGKLHHLFDISIKRTPI